MLRFGIIFLKLTFIFFLSSCTLDEPIEFYSPAAGFLQVFITSDDADTTINILGIDYSISESDSMDHLPPMQYKSLTVGIIASVLEIGPYRIPVSLPLDVDGVLAIPVDFIVSENSVTKITLSIKPFESMTRYQDSYVFDRVIIT